MWIEPKTEQEREELRKKGLHEVRVCVCYKCGRNGTLYRVAKNDLGETIYGCSAHRGLIGQVE